MNARLHWNVYLFSLLAYLTKLLTGVLIFSILLYMTMQMYFWFNPAPEEFWFFNMIDKY